MAERTPAPGRVDHPFFTGPYSMASGVRALCGVCPEWISNQGIHATVAAAADALRQHLRTEHADLWEVCPACVPGYSKGHTPGEPFGWVCSYCHGRGYVEAFRYCGRGICCLEDGHEGKCTR